MTDTRLDRRMVIGSAFAAAFVPAAALLSSRSCAQSAPSTSPSAGLLSVTAFGAVGDDSTDDARAFQRAIDTAAAQGGEVLHTPGAKGYRLADGLSLVGRDNVGFDFHKSAINFYGSGNLFDLGANGAKRVDNPSFSGGRLVLWTPGATAFHIENAYAPQFRDLDINLRAARQTGFFVKGNRSPPGPYYGSLSNITVYGNGKPGDGQVGYRFLSAGIDGSDGVNRWVFSNLRHVAAVDIGIDVAGCAGLVFDNVNFEATYDTAMRFNQRRPDFSGAVTSIGDNPSLLADSRFRASYDTPSAAVVVLSGRNAGRSKNVLLTSNGQISFPTRFPYNFAKGDRYQLYLAKAVNCHVRNATCETAKLVADFGAGARDCKVELAFCTIAADSHYFRRGIEDMSNTIARDYLVYTFEGSVPAGGGDVWLSPSAGPSNQGGVAVPPYGVMWIDAVVATASRRGVGSAGTVSIAPYVSGVSQGPGLTALLTPDNPFTDGRVRRSLKQAECLRTGDNIKVRAIASRDLQSAEGLRVEIYVGVL